MPWFYEHPDVTLPNANPNLVLLVVEGDDLNESEPIRVYEVPIAAWNIRFNRAGEGNQPVVMPINCESDWTGDIDCVRRLTGVLDRTSNTVTSVGYQFVNGLTRDEFVKEARAYMLRPSQLEKAIAADSLLQ